MTSTYWNICAEGVEEELGIRLNEEQRGVLSDGLERAHDFYGIEHGHVEADKSVARMQREDAQNIVLNFFKKRFDMLESATGVFDALNRTQKAAFYEMLNAREFIYKEQSNG